MQKTRKHEFPEQNPERCELWNQEIWTRMREAGKLPGAEFRKPGQLPPGLCQANTARVREMLAPPCKWIADKQENGTYQVHFITIALPDWMYESGTLTADALIKTREWVARRLRRLSKECRYAAVGVVDISFNDGSRVGEGKVFAVHAHVLVALKIDAKLDATALIKWAFNLRLEGRNRSCGIPRPRKVQTLGGSHGTRADVERLRNYMGKALFPLGNHMRISKISGNSTNTHNRALNVPQLRELLSVLKDFPPERRFILSGFRREGDRILRIKQTHPLKPTYKVPLRKAKNSKFGEGHSCDEYDDYYDT